MGEMEEASETGEDWERRRLTVTTAVLTTVRPTPRYNNDGGEGIAGYASPRAGESIHVTEGATCRWGEAVSAALPSILSSSVAREAA